MGRATMNDIIRDIAPSDAMLGGDEHHYFDCGRSALECIRCALNAAALPENSIRRILDLPCGHGRVLRYLKAAFPDSEITACDLLRDGVDYCVRTFGAVPLYSDENPTKLQVERDAFDLIWVGSLLTHLNADRWGDFLELFRHSLRPSGVLIFSTHGRAVYDKIRRKVMNYEMPYWRETIAAHDYERSGFGYANYWNSESYGTAISRPGWVIDQITRTPEMRIVHFAERAWDNHHDIYACVRDLDWHVDDHPRISALAYLKHGARERLQKLSLSVKPRGAE